MSRIKVPDFLKKETSKKKTSISRTVENLASFLTNDYQKRYHLGVHWEIDMNYIIDDFEDLYGGMSRKEMIRCMLDNYGAGIIETEDAKYRCYDAYLLYEVCSGLNQKNKSLALSSKRRKAKEGIDFRYYNADNVLVVYKGSGGKIRKIKWKVFMKK